MIKIEEIKWKIFYIKMEINTSYGFDFNNSLQELYNQRIKYKQELKSEILNEKRKEKLKRILETNHLLA